MKKGRGVGFYLLVLFFLIIISFVLLTDSKGNGKTVSGIQAVKVLNKGDAKTIDIQKETTVVKEQDNAAKAKIQESYGKLPLYFIANEGQVDKKVKFYEKGGGHTTFFTKEGVHLSLNRTKKSENGSQETGASRQNTETPKSRHDELHGTTELINLSFLNANKNPEIIAEAPQEGKVNYFIGNDPRKWRTNIPTYEAVVYKEVYKNIDMKFYGSNRQLEYDIIVKPGADPSNIKFSYEGIKELKVAGNGDLEIILNNEESIIQRKPYIYQEINGKRIEVDGSFVIYPSPLAPVLRSSSATEDGGEGKGEGGFSYTFQLASFNKVYPLIIDPVLVYSTYLGGSSGDGGGGIAVDSSGNAYVTGYTYSTDFPTTAGAYDTASNGLYDVIVTKLNADGTALVYSTYLGGSRNDIGNGIAVDSSGNAYVTGSTISTDFPTTSGAYDTACGGCSSDYYDAFITKLNADGTALVYSTYLGGSRSDIGYGIAVDSSNNVYVTGATWSTDFPTTTGAYDTVGGGDALISISDAFITKLNVNGTALVYSTYLGGSASEFGGNGIAVDSSGNAYVTGDTNSPDFPTTAGAYDTAFNGGWDVFVTKLNADGAALVYSTYLGGSGSDHGNGIALDSSNNAYVTGNTRSTNFPTTAGAYDTVSNGGGDAFVAKLNASGTALVYSTYLGGSGGISYDYGNGIAVDSSGNAYITGYTYSTDFPTQNSFQGKNAGNYDAFVTKLNASGTDLVYSTYLGGSGSAVVSDIGYGIAVDSSGNAYVTGNTCSPDFPTTAGVYDTAYNGSCDAFVAKIGEVSGQYAFSVTKAGAGTGIVTSSPAGINCGTDCYENYAANTVVTLTATPALGSTFAGWSGDADCTDGSVTMDANKTCTATFNTTSATNTLTVTKTGTGTGTVTSSPAGINCGTDCSQAYTSGTSVTLTATPDSSSTFAGWSGDADCSDGQVTMDTDKTCTATFNISTPGQYALNITKAGTGSGTVTSNPAGINCGTDCSEAYNSGTSVTLTATPDSSSTFASWSGDADCSDGVVTMDANKTCTGTFNTTSGSGNTGGGGDSGGGGGGGGGCGGFIQDSNSKNKDNNSLMLSFILMLILSLSGISLARRVMRN